MYEIYHFLFAVMILLKFSNFVRFLYLDKVDLLILN